MSPDSPAFGMSKDLNFIDVYLAVRANGFSSASRPISSYALAIRTKVFPYFFFFLAFFYELRKSCAYITFFYPAIFSLTPLISPIASVSFLLTLSLHPFAGV